jgi:hypothetical protein
LPCATSMKYSPIVCPDGLTERHRADCRHIVIVICIGREVAGIFWMCGKVDPSTDLFVYSAIVTDVLAVGLYMQPVWSWFALTLLRTAEVAVLQ